MKPTSRITVEEVKAAYKKTGFKPLSEEWGATEHGCACAITAVTVARTEKSLSEVLIRIDDDEIGVAHSLNLSDDYFDGFVAGYDAAPDRADKINESRRKEYMLGYNDGLAAHQAMRPMPLSAIDSGEDRVHLTSPGYESEYAIAGPNEVEFFFQKANQEWASVTLTTEALEELLMIAKEVDADE